MPTPSLECIICEIRYSGEDVKKLNYFPETGVCYACYVALKAKPIQVSCFGKKSKGNVLAFEQTAQECRSLCPDRALCPKFVNGLIEEERESLHVRLREKVDAIKNGAPKKKKYPFRPGSAVNEGYLVLLAGITKKGFTQWCRRMGADEVRLLRSYRKEERHGFKWRFFEEGGEGGVIKIESVS